MRWVFLGLGAILIIALLTIASLTLITPDVFQEECDRVQLVPPIECSSVDAE